MQIIVLFGVIWLTWKIFAAVGRTLKEHLIAKGRLAEPEPTQMRKTSRAENLRLMQGGKGNDDEDDACVTCRRPLR
jgi:hypothetical protein